MTAAEWAAAFRRGDPDTLGCALLAALRQAHLEQKALSDDGYAVTDIGELATAADGSDRPDYVLMLMRRVGAILQDQGLIPLAPQGEPEPE